MPSAIAAQAKAMYLGIFAPRSHAATLFQEQPSAADAAVFESLRRARHSANVSLVIEVM